MQRGPPRVAAPTAFIRGNPNLATRVAGDGGPYGVDRMQSKPCNAGRRGQRPVRRNLGGFVLSEPFCHPTFASPPAPLLRGGGSGTGAGANNRNRSDNTPCRGRHISALRAAALRRLRYETRLRAQSWRPARSRFRLPEASVTLHGLEYPAAAAAPLFPKKGSGE